MTTFHLGNGPFMKQKSTTSKMMFHLLIALVPIIIFAFIKNGVIPYQKGYISFFEMLRPLLFIFSAAFTSVLIEGIYAKFILKKEANELKKYLSSSYSLFPGLFLSLVLPINTPIIILLLGVFIAVIIGKMLYGGFGHNIFNPALIGALFVVSMYGGTIATNGGYLNKYELDTVGSATPLSATVEGIGTYETLVTPYGDLQNFALGTIPGAIGETSSILIILAGIYLVFFKVIKWRIPIIYVATVFGMTYMIAGVNEVGLWYPLFQVLSGGLLFGAFFMATDPVTSPVTPTAQTLYALFLGILTVVFRYYTPYPEGVLTAILTMNMFVFILDKIGSRAKFNFNKSVIAFMVAWVLIIGISLQIGAGFAKPVVDNTFSIISKKENGSKIEYIATQKGFVSTIKARVVVDNSSILELEILEQNESYYQYVEEANYLQKFIKTNIEEVDTVSGATVTSTAIKNLLEKVLKDYEK